MFKVHIGFLGVSAPAAVSGTAATQTTQSLVVASSSGYALLYLAG